MQQFTYVITDLAGLHARPAGLLVKCAQGLSSSVTVERAGKMSDAKRLFSVMGLGAKHGDEIIFSIEGRNEETDAVKLKAYCEANL